MRKLLLAAALSASFTASANKNCDAIERMAGAIMESRQLGVLYSDIYKLLSAEKNETARKVGLALVKEAYDRPKYDTEKYQHREISKFRNNVYKICIERAE